jgi:GNAT superfamily N-acetyltransferase
MTDAVLARLELRPMTLADLDRVPLRCQGSREEIAARIADLGAAAILAFDGDRHVAQLQFRRYAPQLRSPTGIWDPLYWGDFGEHAPALPENSLAVFCYHVGQVEDSDARDAAYQGHGIATALLDALIAWARDHGIAALVAKCTPPPYAVMSFMGGLSAARYAERGFTLVSSWIEPQVLDVVRERKLVAEDEDAVAAATVGCCVKRL